MKIVKSYGNGGHITMPLKDVGRRVRVIYPRDDSEQIQVEVLGTTKGEKQNGKKQ